MDNFFEACLTSISSLLVLFVFTKIIGNRQLAQFSMLDYIIGITIGSMAAAVALGEIEDIIVPVTAMSIYTLFPVLINLLTSKSLSFRRMVTGETLILMDDGKIYKGNLKKAKIDISEMLSSIRDKGFFHLSDVQTILIEPNGKISVLATEMARPLTPKDAGKKPPKESYEVNLILDGKILEDNLKFIGKDRYWLAERLADERVSSINEVILATIDKNNKVNVYTEIDAPMSRDVFE